MADEGLRVLNRAAEDAVGEAIPIFTDAITGMTIVDAKNILMGDKNSATLYLKSATSAALYQKFNPIINNSFKKRLLLQKRLQTLSVWLRQENRQH